MSKFIWFLLGAAALLPAFGSVPAHAQADTFPVLISASGGISRGAYQAGVNWALVQVFKQSRNADFRDDHDLNGVYRIAVATGASAGNVNAAFSAIEDCAAPTGNSPESSLFWKLWANMGWDQLYDPDIRNPQTDSSLLSRRYIDTVVFKEMEKRMAAPNAERGCDIPIGITLTKVGRDSVEIRPGLSAATQRLATVFSIRERGGRLVFAYPDYSLWSNRALGRVILGPSVSGRDEIDPGWIRDAMQASGAFPLAFQPVSLPYHEAVRLDGERRCRDATTGADCGTRAVFIDGGLFDNNPLAMALEMYDTARAPAGWRGNTRVIYIDTDKLRGDAATAAAHPQIAVKTPDRGLSTLLQVATAAVPAARQYELQALARSLEDDSIRAWIHVTTRSQPMIGGYLGGFAAFLGRPFREYDFYTGIYDGLRYAATSMTTCEREPEVARCQAQALRGLITDARIPLGTLAPHALRAAYRAEYREDILLPAVPAPTTALDAARLDLLNGMLYATGALVERTRARPWDNALNCKGRPWEESLLCTDGFEFILDAFADTARREVRRWDQARECVPARWVDSPDTCPLENSFARLIQAPRPTVRETVSRLIHQMWRVESRLSEDPSTRPLAAEDEVELIDFVFNAFALRTPARTGWDWDPSSIQGIGGHAWRRVAHRLPYSVSALMDGGVEAGWRPTYNLASAWALTVPLSVGYRGGQGRFEPAAGTGVLRRTPGFLLSGVELSAHRVWSWKQKGNETAGEWAFGATFNMVADRFRFGTRYVVSPHPFIQGGNRWSFSVGMNDLNGMLYLLGRLSWVEPEPSKVIP